MFAWEEKEVEEVIEEEEGLGMDGIRKDANQGGWHYQPYWTSWMNRTR
jgi:hypothetical protein